MDDRALAKAWTQGDNAAGDTLVRRHFSAVHRFFSSRVPDSVVDDLTHQTFLACIEQPERFRGDASFKAYLLGIARHLLVDHLRRQARDAATEEPAWSGRDLPTPSGFVADQEQRRLLVRALRRLPLDLQLTVELFYWENLSTKEIAVALDTLPATVRTRLSRARLLLSEQIRTLASTPRLADSTLQRLESWVAGLREHGSDDGMD